MPRTQRVLFERLTWQDGTLVPASPDYLYPKLDSSEDEVTVALMALGGLQCSKCSAPLRAPRGYCCCEKSYCPCCGCELESFYTSCSHHVLSFSRHQWSLWLYKAFAQARTEEGRDAKEISAAWAQLANLTPPARRLPKQKLSGYPRWTEAQKQEAYTSDVLPYLETIFSPTLRRYSGYDLNAVLLPILQPDLKTAISDAYYHWTTHYFCTDPLPALARWEQFMNNLQDGNKRLRAMEPETIARPT